MLTRYYWIVDDYFESGRRNSSRGILYRGSEIEHEKSRDLKASLLSHVFKTPFVKVWGKMFSPNDKDKEVLLSVYGSHFVEMIFEGLLDIKGSMMPVIAKISQIPKKRTNIEKRITKTKAFSRFIFFI